MSSQHLNLQLFLGLITIFAQYHSCSSVGSKAYNTSFYVGIGGMFLDDQLRGIASSHIFPHLYSLNYFTDANRTSSTNLNLSFHPDWINGSQHLGRDGMLSYLGRREARRLLEDHHNAILIDGPSPGSCKATAEEGFFHATPVISHCDSPDLQDKQKFPFVMLSRPRFSDEMNALVKVLRHIGVTHVSIVTAGNDDGVWRMIHAARAFKEGDIEVVRQETIATTGREASTSGLQRIKDSGSRVIVLLTDMASSVFVKVLARNMGMIGNKDYLWLGVGQWVDTGMLRWLPAKHRNVLFGTIALREKPIAIVNTSHFEREIRQFRDYETFTTGKPYLPMTESLNRFLGADFNKMFVEKGYRYNLEMDLMDINAYQSALVALYAINSTVTIMEHFNLLPYCLNSKQFKMTPVPCSLPEIQVSYMYQRSICNETYLTDVLNADILSINGYEPPCEKQEGVEVAISNYRNSHDPEFQSMASAPGILLLQRLYLSRFVSPAGEILSVDKNGQVKNAIIEIFNGQVVSTNTSTTMLNVPDYAKNYSFNPHIDPIDFFYNTNSSLPFYNLTVEYYRIGQFSAKNGLKLEARPQFYSDNPSVKNLQAPSSMVSEDDTNAISLWVYAIASIGVLIFILSLLSLCVYQLRKKRLISQCTWLLFEEELTSGCNANNIEKAASEVLIRSSIYASSISMTSFAPRHFVGDNETPSVDKLKQTANCSGVCCFKKNEVYWKQICVGSIDLQSSDILKCLYAMKERSAVSGKYFVNQFVGMTTTRLSLNCWIFKLVWGYEPRGSLDDMLNSTIGLRMNSDVYKANIMLDIAKGLQYIHEIVDINVHGCLRASNCLIDQQWTCRLTDFGLSCLYSKRQQMPKLEGESLNQPRDSEGEDKANSGSQLKESGISFTGLEKFPKQKSKRLSFYAYKSKDREILYYSPSRLDAYRKGERRGEGKGGSEVLKEHQEMRSQEDDIYACGLVFYEIVVDKTLPRIFEENSISIRDALLKEHKSAGDVIDFSELPLGMKRLIESLTLSTDVHFATSPKSIIRKLNVLFPETSKEFFS